MTDRRATPDRARTDRSDPARICVPVSDLLAAPGGSRDRQLLYGDDVTVLGVEDAHAYLCATKDGYHGFVARSHLGPVLTATHRVRAPATHVYADANLKSPDLMSLSFGSRIHATAETGTFVETPDGYIPVQHLAPADEPERDPLDVARRFLGTPYLWGGNSRAGIDCSGLVQAALLATGHACPGDSDQQRMALGAALPDGAPRRAGDLLFWRGHVAFVHDERRLLHANAFHMATAFEEIESALRRIDAHGDGPLLAHRRI